MTILQRMIRLPNLIIGVVTAFLNMLNILNITHLSGDQVAVMNIFFSAVFALVTAVVTPSVEVIAQQKPGEAVKATAKAEANFGLTEGAVVHINEAA